MNKYITKTIVLMSFIACAEGANATFLNVQQLKKANTSWQMEENHLSQLPVEDLRRMMGYNGKIENDISITESEDPNLKGKSIDWRNHEGQNWVSPVLDQGGCGSCVAFAAVGTLETQMNISQSLPWLNQKFSAQALFSCGGGSCDMGWLPGSAVSYLKKKGVPDEACAPYLSGATGEDVACNTVCSDVSKRSQKIISSSTLRGSTAVKNALLKGPLITTMSVYADFILYKSGIYKHVAGEVLGGHAVSLVGFDDIGRYWIIRNSWSKGWGENGFAMISYDDISGIGLQGWSMELPSQAGVVSIENLVDRDFTAGQFEVSVASTYSKTKNLKLTVESSMGREWVMECDKNPCDIQVDSTQMNDGRFTLRVDALEGNVVLGHSQEKYFYILNHEPTSMNLRYAGKSVDLKKPLKGRIELGVKLFSTPVPFTELEFVVKQGDKIIKNNSSTNIASDMIVGWRTNSVPNGQYEINVIGKFKSGDKVYTQAGQPVLVTVQN